MTKSNDSQGTARLDKLALTISPSEFIKTEDEAKQLYNIWLNRFIKLKGYWMLYPEFAYNEDKNSLRLHFHGIISSVNNIELVENMEILKAYAFCKLKPINNMSKWLKYCRKDIVKTKKTLGLKRNKTLPISNENEEILELKYNDDYRVSNNNYWERLGCEFCINDTPYSNKGTLKKKYST